MNQLSIAIVGLLLAGCLCARVTTPGAQNADATQQAEDRLYALVCSQHNGYISEFGNCVVDYPGWPSQRVTVNRDGTWNAYQAEINRGDCEVDTQDAALSALEGWPWTELPLYHPDTGVCTPGSP